MEQVNIDWDGPYEFDKASNLNGPSDYGVYQFYGTHQVYGADSLLYIGRARGIKFGARISQHKVDDWLGSSAKIYVGRLCGESQPSNERWDKLIDRAESLLIYVHAPSWNSSNIQSFGDIGKLIILNWGNRGQLLSEVSTLRWDAPNNNKPMKYKIYEET